MWRLNKLDIKLISDKYQVTKIKKKTSAFGFKELEVGDYITFSMDLEPSGRGSHGCYATNIDVTIEKSKSNEVLMYEEATTLNNITRRLSCFDLLKVRRSNEYIL